MKKKFGMESFTGVNAFPFLDLTASTYKTQAPTSWALNQLGGHS